MNTCILVEITSTFLSLPEEIKLTILTFMPVELLFVLCNVCTEIKQIIDAHADLLPKPKQYQTNLCLMLATNGYGKLLDWVFKITDELYLDEKILKSAVENGHLSVLKVLNKCTTWKKGNWIDTRKAANGQINTLTWISIRTAERGYFAVFKWLIRNNYKWDFQTVFQIVKNGHFDILKWIHTALKKVKKIKYPSYNDYDLLCNAAAEGNHLDILIWLKVNGCKWNKMTFNFAAINGNVEMLKYLLKYDCPIDDEITSFAAKKSNIHALQWFYENDFKFTDKAKIFYLESMNITK